MSINSSPKMHDLACAIVHEARSMEEHLIANSPEEFFSKNKTDSIHYLFDMKEPRFDWIPRLVELGSDVPKSSVQKALKFGRVDVAYNMLDLIFGSVDDEDDEYDDKEVDQHRVSTSVKELIDLANKIPDVSAKIIQISCEILIHKAYSARMLTRELIDIVQNCKTPDVVKNILDMVSNLNNGSDDTDLEDVMGYVDTMFANAVKDDNTELAKVIVKNLVSNYGHLVYGEDSFSDTMADIFEKGNVDLAKTALVEMEAHMDLTCEDKMDFVNMARRYDKTVTGHAMEDTVRTALKMKKRKRDSA